jgi:transposase
MAKSYSIDLRNRVILKHKEGKTISEISNELSVKKTFIYNMLELYRKTGFVEPKPHTGGRKPTLDEERLLQIEALIIETPDITLQEIKDALGLTISLSIICDAVNKKLNLRLKKNNIRYRAEQ